MPRAQLRPEIAEELKAGTRKREHGGGRPEWDPSDEVRAVVQRLAGIGVPQQNIAKLVDVSIHTLRKHCQHELDLGIAQTRALVLNRAFEAIMNGSEKILQFYLATQLGWALPKDGTGLPTEDLGTMSDAELRAELDALSSRERVAAQARGLAAPV